MAKHRILDWFRKKPSQGEQTDQQKKGSIGDVAQTINLDDGNAPGTGDYRTYRAMRRHPTVALARAVAQAPNLTAGFAVQSDEGNDDPAREAVDDMVESLWPFLVHNMLYALDYGWQPFEKVWALDGSLLTVCKMKPLLPDNTQILTDAHGAFAGLKQGNTTLPPENSFVMTYDQEGGNLYGRSRHENIRDEYNNAKALLKKQDQYNAKVSSVVPIIEYPEGSSRDRNGAEQDNYKLAEKVLQSLGSGHGVAMPNTLARFASDLVRQGASLEDMKAWHLQFLEVRGNHGSGFVEQRRYSDALLMRGWLIPERVATEGQLGTKAESVAHADIALMIADQFFESVIRHANWYLVDPFVAYNFGVARVGSVRLESVGLDRAQREFYRTLLDKVLGNPQNIDVLLDLLEVREMAEALGLPVTEQEDLTTPEPDEGDEPEPKPDDVLGAVFDEAHGGGN